MYEYEKEMEKKQGEEAKHQEEIEDKASQDKLISLFGGLSTNANPQKAPGSPTSFDSNLYRLILKLFQNCKDDNPVLIQTLGMDLIDFILKQNKHQDKENNSQTESQKGTSTGFGKNTNVDNELFAQASSQQVKRTNIKKVGHNEFVFSGFPGIFGQSP